MIIDASMFYNEFELMELRLRHLTPVVDRFLIVEANLTHQGHEREMIWEKEWPLWKSITDKIDYVQADISGASREYGALENAHRNAIDTALETLGIRNNPTFISDADELVDARLVKRIAMEPRLTYLRQRLHYYWVNAVQAEVWTGTVMRPADCMRSAQSIRDARHNPEFVDGVRFEGLAGWHWSYLGGTSRIVDKLASIYHVEVNRPPFNQPDYIDQCMAEGRDLFEPASPHKRLSFVELASDYPPELPALVAKYPHLVESA